jgi:opacity protein-like surface antigen
LAFLQLRHHFSSPIAFRILIGVVLLSGIRSGVTQTVNSKLPSKKLKPHTDLSLGIFGQLTPTRIPTSSVAYADGSFITQKTQGTSPSAGVLGTLHQSFKPWLAYNVNLGYTRFSENYSIGQGYVPGKDSQFPAWSTFSQGSIGTNMYELTVAYVFEGPRNKRFNTFGQFGGGGLFFLPTDRNSPFHQQTRPAMLFGVGMNYKLTDHLDIRAEYRGFFYKNPDFAYPLGVIPMSKLFTVTSAPAVSLVYRFGGPKKLSAKSH